jgi:serine/threonine protein kinase
VDFGLSGRHLRPGCGTLEYSAPEILGVVLPGVTPTPASADIYAFACTAFEVFTGTLLFDAEDEVTLMNRHVEHDGWPPGLAALADDPDYSGVATVLAACLRRNPEDRPTAAVLRPAFLEATRWLRDAPWPLGRARPAAVAGISA